MSDRLATYRLQLRREFGFAAAAGVAGYLRELGVSHLYCSPSLEAVPDSPHGYDVVDPTRLAPELGGEAGHATLRAAARAHGLRLLLDIVPNHMAAHPRNPWWWDVLEDGRGSPFADHFDIDWESALDPSLRGRVLLCVLDDHLGRVCERGGLRVERRSDGRLAVSWQEGSAPLSPASVAPLLSAAGLQVAARAAAAVGGGDALKRRRERDAVWDEVRRACEDEHGAHALDAQLAALNRDAPALLRLLGEQQHRLARWRLGLRVLTHRRFFDIMSLVALRAESAEVFRATHAVVLDLLRRGDLDGVRVDHVDGLRDPRAYLRRLREHTGAGAWIVVEKILAHGETLPGDWPVEGSTGYEFAALLARVLTDPSGEAPLLALHAELGGGSDLDAEVRRAKLQVMAGTLRPDVDRLTLMLRDVCAANPRHTDHTVDELRDALAELLAALAVYRTYAVPGEDASADDAARMRAARDRVVATRPDLDRELLDLLCSMVTSVAARGGDPRREDFVQRLQQLSGAAMAKGVEDTVFYRFTPLLSHDEVGCAPLPFSASVEDFHRHNLRVQERWPHTLLATTTHDTKRSEDVRARLSLLAEMPERWAQTVRAWRGRNMRHRRGGMPDAQMEHLLYQSLVGAWPIDRERMQAYIDKASREAKLHTSWIDPQPAYDAALRDFVAALYADASFLAEVEEVVRPLVAPGRVNALAMALLKLTSPGVPDIYQGTELWTLTLVDPDNRRPVDYAERQQLLDLSGSVDAATAWRVHADSGLPKVLLTRRALALRRRCSALFGAADGAYRPLQAEGARAGHVIAFARGAQPGAVTVVPRFPLRLGGDWAGTRLGLPPGEWHDQLCSRVVRGEVALAELLADFPVALLARQSYAEAAAS